MPTYYQWDLDILAVSWTIFDGVVTLFTLKVSSKCLYTQPSYILSGNSSKLCMLAYYHMEICISFQHFWKSCPFWPTIFHKQKLCKCNSPYILNKESLKRTLQTWFLFIYKSFGLFVSEEKIFIILLPTKNRNFPFWTFTFRIFVVSKKRL